MTRSSLVLSLLTAMLASEHTKADSHPVSQNQNMQAVQVIEEDVSEQQQIIEDARRSVGHALCDL